MSSTSSSASASLGSSRRSSEDEYEWSNTRDFAYLIDGGRRTQVPIAVVGMSCRLPGHSSSPTKLWEFLQKGGVAENEPPSTRFSLAGHYDKTTRPRTMKSPGGMFMEYVDPAVFDGQFFNTSRADCIAMEPQQRQMLEVAYECLENGGVPLDKISGTKTGVIVGTNFIDYNSIQARDPEDRADSITIGLSTALLSNRVSHWLNAQGPSMTIDTACSASLVSVDVACRYLDSFQADGMIVGGTNLWMSPEHNEEVGLMHQTQSASGKCHSFDSKADGYVKAEGINCVYLKRLDDAIRDNDPIRAVIRGTASNASGRTAGIANPSDLRQADVIRAAYKNAGISDFTATQFLECHGTGTLAGDPIEVKGAANVFAQGREAGRELIIGSIKANIGHSEAAAGISGLLKAIMAVERGIIPGNPTFLNPNPRIDWETSRVRVSRTSLKWPRGSTVRRASVNSFGFGGANAHAVIENIPEQRAKHVSSYQQVTASFFDDEEDDEEPTIDRSVPPTLLVFSANEQASLKSYAKALSTHLLNLMVGIELPHLAYTLSERRSRLYHRAFTTTYSSRTNITEDSLVMGKQASSAPRIGFVFTGQGAQRSQMGAELVEQFPLAKVVIQELDKVLQALPEPPSWTLLEELTSPRSGEALRQPEFSQPLVTALQLALHAVLQSWGVQATAVVGHSSGEIAAAAAAGLISSEDAIVTAFYRGQAAKKTTATQEPVGMLAIGIGAEQVQSYLRAEDGKVQIACFNSPSSLTMSGTVAALEKLRDRLQTDGHFARMLLVDLAYHSDHMLEIGETYEEMLLGGKICQCSEPKTNPEVRMFSSVTGKLLDTAEKVDAAYWKANMVSPVQFCQAATELLKDTQLGADFLIELGPSGALSGPVSQIKKAISSEAPYTFALDRGSTQALFKAAGHLFIAGGDINLAKVNRIEKHNAKTVIDLPNYAWNHSTRYWHETRASKDWRFKKFVHHDLLGSKIGGTAWQAPTFKKVLKLADMPWLRDHKLGSEIVFPAAAYVSMAIEAVFQTTMSTVWDHQPPAQYRYRLKDVKLSRALVLEENAETRLTLSLTPVQGGTLRTWYEYRVCSEQEELAMDPVHSTGFVCIETDYQQVTPSTRATESLELPTPARTWYKALADLGYNFGPCFQKHLRVESTIGKRSTRSDVDLQPPPSTDLGQSHYPMHPAVMDSCFQTGSPSLFNCDLPSSNASVLVPKIIDSIVLEGGRALPVEGRALSSATFLGVGNKDQSRNYATNVELYDPVDGSFLFEMKGLASAEFAAREEENAHAVTHLAWSPDVDALFASPSDAPASKWLNAHTTQDVLNLVAHKKPSLSVAEFNLLESDDSSLWMPTATAEHAIRSACSQYIFGVSDPKTIIKLQEALALQSPAPQFQLTDISKPAAVPSDVKVNLAILKATGSEISPESILASLVTSVAPGGFIVASGMSQELMNSLGKTMSLSDGAILCQMDSDKADQRPIIKHLSMMPPSERADALISGLHKQHWVIETCSNPIEDVKGADDVVLVVDELFDSIVDRFDEKQFEIIKTMVERRCTVLWVTAGGQLKVTDPNKAAVVGLFRTVRAEEQVKLVTLDVESADGDATIAAISSVLDKLCLFPKADQGPMDSEFVERDGIIHVSRLLPDDALSALQSDSLRARPTITEDLHASKVMIQLRAERLGDLDSVHFGEAATEAKALSQGTIEVEVVSAGLNYKDVVVGMGIVPGDETQMGHEAAGVVTQVADDVSNFSVGDRVVVFGKGCFANRLHTTPDRAHRIPDDMSFEEAATLAVVYLTSMHSLFDLGGLSAGKKVLIHSAAGGVGIAAVQLAQHAGAEVFVTVGSTEKRAYLKSTFGLQDKQIFNSRNTDFGKAIMTATGGRGVDIILNSLTGDMLDESFRVLADGGIMVEIGKKDIIERNNLTMMPFDRNISFRAVDLSPERAPDALVARHLSKLFELIKAGRVKPINPIHRFSWTDIPAAIRFLRPGNHIGKVVLSDGADAKIDVPVRKAQTPLRFRDDGCYLIVGGLRGLCGSLAVYLAKSGARRLAVMSRSGYADDKSRGVLKQIAALGAHIDLLTADVTKSEDVRRAFAETTVPIAGIIQGAMVLRDRPFYQMTFSEYHEAMACKIQGTWNLHDAAAEAGLQLDFFTMLSSISGVIGNRGQANYSAANVFLDAFAYFRRSQGLSACSVDLGVIEDAGVIAENADLHNQFDSKTFAGINDGLLRKILYMSILQQTGPAPPSKQAATQMITGLVTPQPADSVLTDDARFAALFTGKGDSGGLSGAKGGNAEVQAVLLLLASKTAEPAAVLKATIDAVNGCFVRMLQLPEPMDPARPLSVYGIDSLAAVEVRNWVRTELNALVTTLDILNASSLTTFCEKIIAKLAGDKAE
ncbi:hypothetical protein CKM354_000742000 [Cercospora kikuchii]|uniref:Polyketide synthase n=1 Tax=Cercospora kikuchii TaxID=84275 RepID=A0A9P3CK47_9PEZI|nr:uncharacterized protein CKM354_000742000 [Cercospora kikuchii]GIZ44216.1 hypothetical protein CKM354_000742000 [Cercospora kikuchii]